MSARRCIDDVALDSEIDLFDTEQGTLLSSISLASDFFFDLGMYFGSPLFRSSFSP